MAMAEAFPLYWPEGWKRARWRTRSAFKIQGFGRVRDLLFSEIRRMGGTSVVLSSNIALRRDGLPYANTREPDDPGVAVYFTHKKRQMCFACDQWKTVRENAYAIAKTIEALRGIERWGASDMMERAFTGFAALPEEASQPWRVVLNLENGAVTRDDVEASFRHLAKKFHPDMGGDRSEFEAIVRARDAALLEVCA